jgi:hypothetical protein
LSISNFAHRTFSEGCEVFRGWAGGKSMIGWAQEEKRKSGGKRRIGHLRQLYSAFLQQFFWVGKFSISVPISPANVFPVAHLTCLHPHLSSHFPQLSSSFPRRPPQITCQGFHSSPSICHIKTFNLLYRVYNPPLASQDVANMERIEQLCVKIRPFYPDEHNF